jgi:hypothetical protein
VASWQQQQQQVQQQQQAAQQQAVQGYTALLAVLTVVLLLVTALSMRQSSRHGLSLLHWGLSSRAVRLCGELTGYGDVVIHLKRCAASQGAVLF